jgi:hypothetical protein
MKAVSWSCICAALLLILAMPAGAQSFERHVIGAISMLSEGTLSSGDLNGDGEEDLVYLDRNGNLILIINRYRAQGSFETPIVIATGMGNAGRIRCVDIDRDHDLDLVVMTQCRIGWLENRLNEAEQNFASIRVIGEGICTPNALSIADLDHDNRNDVIVGYANTRSGSQYRGRLGWFRNTQQNGATTFSQLRVINENTRNVRDILVFDYNYDHALDLVVASYENLDQGIALPNGYIPTTGTLAIYYADSASHPGEFSTPARTIHEGSINYVQATAVDLNRDAALDIVSFDYSTIGYLNNHSVFSSQTTVVRRHLWQLPDASFSAPSVLDTYSDSQTSPFTGISHQTPRDLNAADFDADGIADLLVNYPFAWYRNNGAGRLAQRPLSGSSVYGSAASALPIDIDGDGMIDVVSVESGGSPLSWWRNTLPRRAGAGDAWMLME